ncbi:hypothetical protein G6F40_016183 [Rhizopus arrhizus]|nr:hypothetical protein G6F40_016183 [Rhizopus arrhizus]
MQQVVERAEAGQLLAQPFCDHLHFFFIDRDAPFLDEAHRLHLHPACDGIRRPGIDVDSLVLDAVEQVLMRGRQHLLVLLGLRERQVARRVVGQHRAGGGMRERGYLVFHCDPPRARESLSRSPCACTGHAAGSRRETSGARARR